MNKPTLSLNLSQSLVMTPQLRQAIELLQMSALDLNAFVDNEMLENPYLASQEEGEETANVVADETPKDTAETLKDGDFSTTDADQDFNWDNVYDGDEPAVRTSNTQGDDASFTWENTTSEVETLVSALETQFHLELGTLAQADDSVRFIGLFLIDSIDDSGYLRAPLADVAKKLAVPLEKVEDALAIIQCLEPAGIGARDLAECLMLQLHAEDNLTDTAQAVLNNLSLVAKQDFKKLATLAGATEADVREAIEDITACNPKPGLVYGGSKSDAIIPDIIVQEGKTKGYSVELNSAALPKILINHKINDVFTGANKDAQKYLSDRMGRAKWLLNSLESRAKNMFNIAKVIVSEQADFFAYGVESLKPLTLKQVAELVDVHESTVSRITTSKYMQTPRGTFELKYFFSAGIGTTGGNVEVAAEGVKAMIKRLIDAEMPQKPVSDEKLVSLLKDEGVTIARRTVAKYREALGILSSSGRRVR